MKLSFNSIIFTALLATLDSTTTETMAFTVKPMLTNSIQGVQHHSSLLQLRPFAASKTGLRMSEEGEDGGSDVPPEAGAGDVTNDEGETEETVEAVPEDPEITALKEEIATLESELKAQKSSLTYAQDQVEEYSKAGYARAVAEMENTRRVRKSMNSSSQSNAMAGILRDFLPVYDKMEGLKEKYANDEFGSKFGGLSIAPTLQKMGVQEFTIAEGQQVDAIRMNIVASEHSDVAPKDTVLAQVASGMELEGNVVRAAACVASLGPEQAAETGDDEASSDATQE